MSFLSKVIIGTVCSMIIITAVISGIILFLAGLLWLFTIVNNIFINAFICIFVFSLFLGIMFAFSDKH